MFDQLFANLATGFADTFRSPFTLAAARWEGETLYDDGGSIVAPGTPTDKACRVQFDAATQAMRDTPGFLETDVRIIVLAASLAGTLDTSARIVVEEGQYAGTWSLLSVTRDPASIGYECRARRA